MGQDMVLTLTDEDLNLNSDSAETYVLNLIEWDSSADSSQLLSDSTSHSLQTQQPWRKLVTAPVYSRL